MGTTPLKLKGQTYSAPIRNEPKGLDKIQEIANLKKIQMAPGVSRC